MILPLRGAARTLLRSPGFAALTVGTLALGIGTVTATVTVLHQAVLRPLPVVDQDAVVVAWGDHRVRDFPHYPFLREAWLRVRDDARSLASVAATDAAGIQETPIDDEPRAAPVRVARTVGDVFGVLGVSPVLGRTLEPADEDPGAPRVLVISHGLWIRWWGGDPAAVGASLAFGGERFRVVGVMPEGLDYPTGAEVWTPALPLASGLGGSAGPYLELDLVGRLAPGATGADAAAEIERLLRGDPALAETYRDVRVVTAPLAEVVTGDLGPTLWFLAAGALLVLAVALFDVANLVLVRGGGRVRATAIRRALGADGGRLAGEALAEALLLGALAGVVGAALAVVGVARVLPLAPAELHRLGLVHVDGSTLAVALGATAVVTLALAALSLFGTHRVQPAAALRGGPGSVGGGVRAGRVILGAESALAVWAVAVALLMTSTLRNMHALELGFRAQEVTVLQLDHDHAIGRVPETYPRALEAVVERLVRAPGVAAATPVIAPPLAASSLDAVLRVEGQTPEEAAGNPYLNTELVLPGYFDALEVPLLRGRTFASDIGAGAPGEIVVNAAAARSLWPGQDPLGRRVSAFAGRGEDRWWTVVGVVADTRYRALLEPRPSAYFPLTQLPLVPPGILLVRTAGPAGAVDPLRLAAAAFAEADPSVRVVGASSLAERLGSPLARPRLSLVVMGALGAVVLLLAGVGVYGVMAAAVRSRHAEMGVRMACGATPVDVVRLVVRQGLAPAVVGALLGLAASLASGRGLASLLYGIRADDPRTLAAAAALVLAVAAAACLPSALLAARTDPVAALEHDG